MKVTNKVIGIVGGVGPLAGVELNKKLYEFSASNKDQDYPSIILASYPSKIVDRTEFLLGKLNTNPAIEIANVILKLDSIGATHVIVACNTSHARSIFNKIISILNDNKSKIEVVHVVREVCGLIEERFVGKGKLGVLATNGTVYSKVYDECWQGKDREIIYPSEGIQNLYVQDVIYNTEYGIKSHGFNRNYAHEKLSIALNELVLKGAEVIVLACTELPIVVTEQKYLGVNVVSSIDALAKRVLSIKR